MILPSQNLVCILLNNFERPNRFLLLLNGYEEMFNPYCIVTKPGRSPWEAPEVWAAWIGCQRTLPFYCTWSGHSRAQLPMFYLQKCAGMGTLLKLFLLPLEGNGKQQDNLIYKVISVLVSVQREVMFDCLLGLNDFCFPSQVSF